MTLVAIHQPNFFPWLGYFDKIIRADAFVLLDHVQFPKTGAGVWLNRVKLRFDNEAHWVTAPVARNFHGLRAIRDMEFENRTPWRDKLLKTVTHQYSRAPHFKEILKFFAPLILNSENNISAYNKHAILEIAAQLGVAKEKFYQSSDLPHQNAATAMLISLTQALGGGAYLCGGGAGGYQDDALFAAMNIKLTYQNFEHPIYVQALGQEFIAGLSIIDALMYCGWRGVKAMLGKRYEINNEMA